MSFLEAATGYFESFANHSLSQQENSEAEWITDIVVRAGKQKDDNSLVESYEKSEMKRSVEAEVESKLEEKSGISQSDYKQLSTERATVTPFWYGVLTFIKVWYSIFALLHASEFIF